MTAPAVRPRAVTLASSCLATLFFAGSAVAVAQPVVPATTEHPPSPRSYVCYRSPGPLVLDGRLDDDAWRAAEWSQPFVDIEGARRPAPRWSTRVKLLWDDSALYIGAELEESHVWATLTRRDTVIFHDNDFEVFLDPDGDTHHYYELQINALGTVWDLLLVKPYRDGGPALTEWDIAGLRSAVDVDGTLNDPSDTDGGWSVELALPWSALPDAPGRGRPPRPGEQWRVNFSRVQWRLAPSDAGYTKAIDPASGDPFSEDNWVWSPQDAVNMHMPEMWGIVQFAAEVAGEARVTVQPLKDARLRWALRRVYYAQRSYHSAHGRFARSLEELGLSNASQLAGPPRIVGSGSGATYVASVIAPDGTRLSIREDGHLWSARSP